MRFFNSPILSKVVYIFILATGICGLSTSSKAFSKDLKTVKIDSLSFFMLEFRKALSCPAFTSPLITAG